MAIRVWSAGAYKMLEGFFVDPGNIPTTFQMALITNNIGPTGSTNIDGVLGAEHDLFEAINVGDVANGTPLPTTASNYTRINLSAATVYNIIPSDSLNVGTTNTTGKATVVFNPVMFPIPVDGSHPNGGYFTNELKAIENCTKTIYGYAVLFDNPTAYTDGTTPIPKHKILFADYLASPVLTAPGVALTIQINFSGKAGQTD